MDEDYTIQFTLVFMLGESDISPTVSLCLEYRTEMTGSMGVRTAFPEHALLDYANGLPQSVKLRYDTVIGTFKVNCTLCEATRPFISKEIYERKQNVYMTPVFSLRKDR